MEEYRAPAWVRRLREQGHTVREATSHVGLPPPPDRKPANWLVAFIRRLARRWG